CDVVLAHSAVQQPEPDPDKYLVVEEALAEQGGNQFRCGSGIPAHVYGDVDVVKMHALDIREVCALGRSGDGEIGCRVNDAECRTQPGETDGVDSSQAVDEDAAPRVGHGVLHHGA